VETDLLLRLLVLQLLEVAVELVVSLTVLVEMVAVELAEALAVLAVLVL
jgi:hypothetical protein